MDLRLFPRQAKVLEFIENGAQEILYGGAAGSAKSHLLRIIAIIWCMRVAGLTVYLFRRQVKDLRLSHMIGANSLPALVKPLVDDKLVNINLSDGVVSFKNGSKIVLAHCQYESDLENYLSTEINVLLLDEGSTFTEKMYKFLRSRVRIGGLPVPEQWRGSLPFILIATNPRGELHKYLKTSFVDAAEPDEVFTAPEEDGGMRRVFVPARITDNYVLMKNDPGYVNRLKGMYSPELVQAYLMGDWSIAEDTAIPEFSSRHNVVPRFNVPFRWKIKRCYDYGYSAPYSVLWLAEANGDSVIMPNGEEFCPPKGSIIVCGEIYGDKDGKEQGLKEDVLVTAKKIRSFELLNRWNVLTGPADHSIFSKEHGRSVHDVFVNEGIKFKPAIKKAGSRINGLALIRQMMWQAHQLKPERAALYIMDSCPRLIRHLKLLRLDDKNSEDVDTECDDHDYDTLRYGVLDIISSVKVKKVKGL